MGLGIGQIPSGLSSATAQQSKVLGDASPFDLRSQDIDPVRREQGIAGQDSRVVSASGAALNAINSGVRTAREAIPTLEKIREDFQLRREQIQAQFETSTERQNGRRSELRANVETRIPEPSPRALEFRATDNPQGVQPGAGATRTPAEPVDFTFGRAAEPVEFASAQAAEAIDFASAAQPADRAIEQQEAQQAATPAVNFFEGLGNGGLDLTA